MRAEYYFERKDFCEDPVCGDLPMRLSMALAGKGYYIDKCMSAYRTGNPSSMAGNASGSFEKRWSTVLFGDDNRALNFLLLIASSTSS